MKVQRVRLAESERVTWILLDDEYLPCEPVNRLLRFLEHIDRSPSTVRTYAYHLKLFWEYLTARDLDWKDVGVDDLASFTSWLRQPDPPNLVRLQTDSTTGLRTKRTIYSILGAVHEFYEYHIEVGTVADLPLYRFVDIPNRRYKDFLYHVNKSRPVKTRIVTVKRPDPEKYLPKTLTAQQVERLLEACNHLRDRFLVNLLYRSGIRIGQALGLRHEDIRS